MMASLEVRLAGTTETLTAAGFISFSSSDIEAEHEEAEYALSS